MSRWHKLIHQTETQFDRALDQFDGDGDPLLIQSYLGYGVPGRAFVMGRVLEDRGVARAEQGDSLWENFKGAWKRFRSGEVRHAELNVSLETPTGSFRRHLRADDEGHIAQWLELPDVPPDADNLLTLELELTHPKRTPPVRAEASVLIPSASALFGVISDIDDTVLQTGATSVRSLAKQVLFGNAHTRLPFEGVAAFYEALSGSGNPLFYVSSSPWNLYDVLVEFMELNDIPLGPIMLRDWGLSASELLPTTHGAHKRDAIGQILKTYPKLPFILIGDSGQEDPEIYHQVVRDFPGRVLGVYIRDVDENAERRASVQRLAREVEGDGSTLLLTQSTAVAAEHAAAQGWIPAAAVSGVAERRAEDIAKPA